MIDKNITNSVRQILMNELGLTREIIRNEMEKIIRDTASKYFNNVMNRVDKMIEERIEYILQNDKLWIKRERLDQLITNEIEKKLVKKLADDVTIKLDIQVKKDLQSKTKDV